MTRVLVALLVGLAGCHPSSTPAWTTPVTGQGPVLLSVWGTSSTDLWTVGGTRDLTNDTPSSRKSLVLHFDGSAWTKMDAGVPSVLWWTFGFGKNDVWIAGEQATILHYNGSTFAPMPSGVPQAEQDSTVLFGIWGSSPTDIYAVGGRLNVSSTILHYDGKAWAPMMNAPQVVGTVGTKQFPGTWLKVWGTAANDVWFVGAEGFLVHYDGMTFNKVDLGPLGITTESLFTVAGRARDDVYVVGGLAAGIALHYDGKSWAHVPGLDLSSAGALTGVYETSAGDVCITGLGGAKIRGSGGTWTDDSLIGTAADLHAVWMAGPEDIFAAGGNYNALLHGVIAHYGQPVSSTIK